ncbi:MAG: helix-turn-helix transcriptional regulator [Deltaproteobacteria bacterium]|nr:helix-turn-helix transcriptional regulator [Deltaproteobacteria bacterium]
MPDRDRRPSRPRLSREAWEDAALEAIAQNGLSALAIEPLARRLEVSKGSFYWHFDDREALLEAVLSRWEQRSVAAAVDRVASQRTPQGQFGELLRLALEEPQLGQLELIFGAAAEHPLIGSCLQRVQGRRLTLFTERLVALGLAPEVAARRALLCCAAQLGLCHLLRTEPSGQAAALDSLLSELVGGWVTQPDEAAPQHHG